MSSEWSSIWRAAPCHRTRSSVGDEFEGKTQREALRYRRLTRGSWRVRRVHHAGGLAHPVRFGRKEGEHVCLDWKGEEPPSNMHDGRAAAAPMTMKLSWTTMFSHLKRITREGIRARQLLVLVDSRVVLGAVSKGRSSSRKINFFLRKMGF